MTTPTSDDWNTLAATVDGMAGKMANIMTRLRAVEDYICARPGATLPTITPGGPE